jgi:transcriptional regulator with XRE-family HTH domain
VTTDSFAASLRRLGWTQAEFARRAGVTPKTVTTWAKGQAPVPPWVQPYLDAIEGVRELALKLGAVE